MPHFANTIAAYNQLVQAYEDKFMDLSLYNAGYDLFLQALPPGQPLVLEVGCGPGNISRYLLRQRPELRLHATDAAIQMVERAQVNNPSATCYVLAAADIATLPNTFDGFIAGFCLPYLDQQEALTLVADIAALLRPGGICYLSFIEGHHTASQLQTSSDGKYSMFVFYHQPQDLLAAFQQHHLEVIHHESLPYPAGDGNTDRHCILIARQQ